MSSCSDEGARLLPRKPSLDGVPGIEPLFLRADGKLVGCLAPAAANAGGIRARSHRSADFVSRPAPHLGARWPSWPACR